MNDKRISSRWNRFVLTVAMGFTCIALLTPTQASAQFYVRQPDVEKGVSEVEEHGAVYVSPGDDEDLRQSHEVEFKRGLTDRAQLIVESWWSQLARVCSSRNSKLVASTSLSNRKEADPRLPSHYL